MLRTTYGIAAEPNLRKVRVWNNHQTNYLALVMLTSALLNTFAHIWLSILLIPWPAALYSLG